MMAAREDGLQASKFEAALKNRPAPFFVQLRKDETSAQFRIALNVATLAHKALARLPPPPPSVVFEEATVSWRLSATEAFDPMFGHQVSTKFSLSSNRSVFFRLTTQWYAFSTFDTVTSNFCRNDLQSAQPPRFKLDLRPEQLRSLTWMIKQETEPTPWVEEEVSEAYLPHLGWHAEAKAERSVTIKGGVLADEGEENRPNLARVSF
jgi:hypothetical protein